MRTLIHKPRSIGATLLVAANKPMLKLHHLLFYLPVIPQDAGRKGEFSMLIGQVALVEYLEASCCEVQKASYVQIIHQRATDVVDLSAAIFSARVGQKEDGFEVVGTRRQVDKIPLWILPDSVEFGFDVKTGGIPDGPAYQLFSALSDDLLWNDAEAFVLWLARQRFVRNDNGDLIFSYLPTELRHIS